MIKSAKRLVGYTMGGLPVFEDSAEAIHLGGDCHYVPSSMHFKKRKNNMKKKVAGVTVYGVKHGFGAHAARLTTGDVITSVRGRRVKRPEDIRDIIKWIAPGRKLKVKFRYNGIGPSKTVFVKVCKNASGYSTLGICTTPKSWERYKKSLVISKHTAESDVKSINSSLPPLKEAHSEPEVTFVDMSPPKEVGLNAKIASRMAVRDAVVEAKKETVKAIKADDDDYFGKKTKDELALVNGLLNDRKGADAYMAARKLRRELESHNRSKLEAAGDNVSNYLNEMKTATADESVKTRKLSKFGKFVVGTVGAVITIPTAYYIISTLVY